MGPAGATLRWPRVALTVVLLVAVALLVLAVVPDLIVTRLTGVTRDTRALLASAWFFLAFAVLAYVMRRLQARGLL